MSSSSSLQRSKSLYGNKPLTSASDINGLINLIIDRLKNGNTGTISDGGTGTGPTNPTGAIDSTPIGQNSPSVGTFTRLISNIESTFYYSQDRSSYLQLRDGILTNTGTSRFTNDIYLKSLIQEANGRIVLNKATELNIGTNDNTIPFQVSNDVVNIGRNIDNISKDSGIFFNNGRSFLGIKNGNLVFLNNAQVLNNPDSSITVNGDLGTVNVGSVVVNPTQNWERITDLIKEIDINIYITKIAVPSEKTFNLEVGSDGLMKIITNLTNIPFTVTGSFLGINGVVNTLTFAKQGQSIMLSYDTYVNAWTIVNSGCQVSQ